MWLAGSMSKARSSDSFMLPLISGCFYKVKLQSYNSSVALHHKGSLTGRESMLLASEMVTVDSKTAMGVAILTTTGQEVVSTSLTVEITRRCKTSLPYLFILSISM